MLETQLLHAGGFHVRSAGRRRSRDDRVNTWPRWSTGGPLPRLHVVRRALTNRTTTAGSGRCAESEAAAIVTKVTVGNMSNCRFGRCCAIRTLAGRASGGAGRCARAHRGSWISARSGCAASTRSQALMINKTSDHMTDGLKRSVRRKPCAPGEPQEAATLARSSA